MMRQLIKKMFYKQRREFDESMAEREKKFHLPDGVEEIRDVPYGKKEDSVHRMDIYRPEGCGEEKLPVVINIHGGGLILGCKEFNRYFCANLCRMGYVVFSVEYRLVPDCTFFDQCRDVFRAMDTIGQVLEQYGGSPERIYGTGDSGGACLLTYCVAMQNSQALAKAARVRPSELPVKALGLVSGMYYTDRFDSIGLFLPKYLYGPEYRKTKFAPYVNPEHREVAGSLPPCFLVTSRKDSLRRYTINFEKALRKYQIPHKLLEFPSGKNLTHAFSVFHPFLEESIRTVRAISDFFKKIG